MTRPSMGGQRVIEIVAWQGRANLFAYLVWRAVFGWGLLWPFLVGAQITEFQGLPIFQCLFSILLFNVSPVRARAHLHHQRHSQFVYAFHLFFHQSLQLALFLGRQFK